MIKINTSDLRSNLHLLHAGDTVLLSGTIYTARDAAHKKLTELIKNGKELSEKEIKNLLMDSEFSKARDYALNVLSIKSISSADLSKKICLKGYDKIIADEVINELTELGYVDDVAYASLFLEYCAEKMWGKKKIRFEMKQKGLTDEIIESVLSFYSDDDCLETMAEVIISKYGHEDINDIKVKNKITRYFVSRGFDFSKADAAIRLASREISNE